MGSFAARSLSKSRVYLRGGPCCETPVWEEQEVSEVGNQVHGILDPPLSDPSADVSVTGNIQAVKSKVWLL